VSTTRVSSSEAPRIAAPMRLRALGAARTARGIRSRLPGASTGGKRRNTLPPRHCGSGVSSIMHGTMKRSRWNAVSHSACTQRDWAACADHSRTSTRDRPIEACSSSRSSVPICRSVSSSQAVS